MSIVIVGSTALDSIKTPKKENPRLLGGSASYASIAASFFAPVKMVGVVGDDFPRKYISLYKKHGIDIEGLQIKPGKTFHWSGEYEVNMNNRRTLSTELGVFADFNPVLPESYRNAEFVLLANIAPSLQLHVLEQVKKPKFIAADTMDLWLNIALDDLLKLLKKVDLFVLNDSEAKLLTKDDNVISAIKKIHKLGPKNVIIKKGEHGAILSVEGDLFVAPAYPLLKVVDPTGAGDTFLGGLIGYLASASGKINENLRNAVVYGAVTASFCCEGFGVSRLTKVTKKDIEQRYQEFRKITSF